MASEIDQTKELLALYNECLVDVKCNWSKMLDTAAKAYRQNFINQAMIYGQSENITLVASEKEWNKANRYLNFNAKHIKTIARHGEKLLEHRLYDISDTYGDDIILNKAPDEQEITALNQALNNKYKCNAQRLTDVIKTIVAGIYTTSPVEVLLKPYERIIKNSVYYITCKRLDLLKIGLTMKFGDIEKIDDDIITKIGKSISSTSQKLIKNIENELKNIRSAENGRNIYNQRSGIRGTREPDFARQENRDLLQTRIERNGSANFRTVNQPIPSGGQLSFGTLRQSDNGIYGGNEQRPIGYTDVAGQADEDAAPTRGRTEGNGTHSVQSINGEKSTTENGQYSGSGATLEHAENASDRDSERGNLSRNLTYSPKEKFADNINAIKVIKLLESESRLATDEEKNILSKYVGWGGLSQVFEKSLSLSDENKTAWENEYSLLKELLSPAEYESARASTLTAYYTDPLIVSAMYQGLANMNITDTAKVLEPSCGIGKFFSVIPKSFQNAELYGVELDPISGKIAQALYENADIQIKGYQETTFADNSFDVVLGNVPFGDFRIFDERYNKEKFLIHDYFFAKSLDLLKPGGTLAFITSKGTLDKQNSTFRKYIASRAELIGAVRLPDNAFKASAGTEVTTDIIFLQKREKPIVIEPEWVHLGLTENGVPVNQYYIDNPQNLLGNMIWGTSRFGKMTQLKPDENKPFLESLSPAIQSFTQGNVPLFKAVTKPILPTKEVIEEDIQEEIKEEIKEVLPADPNIKNFTYTVINNQLYYRENFDMKLQNKDKKTQERIKSIHAIREKLREIIDLQSSEFDKNIFDNKLAELNQKYDNFVKIYGFLSNNTNQKAFADDGDSPLMLSIEERNEDGGFDKARIFYEPTIRPPEVFLPKTYDDLIILSMQKLGHIDLEFMAEIFSVTQDDVKKNLKSKIFLNPQTQEYETSDYYLTGNVKSKLNYVEALIETHPEYLENVEALKAAQPPPLTIDQIDFKLGSSWIDLKYIRQFMNETANVPMYLRQIGERQDSGRICLSKNEFTGIYTLYNKNSLKSVTTTSMYGTDRKSMFAIIEDSLNLKECRVYDTVPCITKDGKDSTKQVLNLKETQLARQKQELLKNEFKNWICADNDRLSDIVKTYNEVFNVYKTRQYDGSHLTYTGMSRNIEMRPHQNNAVARCLYGGENVLLGHVVGAGKTYTMAAAAMELKRIGIAHKSLFVVPNHLTEQWGTDFLKLYPQANILVATKKDFEPANRKRFVGKICTGDYDAVIIGHSQFEKIPMSAEYMSTELKEQIDEITTAINSVKNDAGVPKYTVKQLESQREKMKTRLLELSATNRKDDLLTFEQTGVDNLFVDEAHYYKNCYVNTKLSNVAGVTTTSAQKSFDMLLKTKYITNKNNGRGVTFATGTPISNSMVEAFVLQRYLQPQALKNAGLSYFDNWASTFGETKMVLELKPEGTGYRMRTRFAKFHNLPELIGMFSQVSDIKVAEDINLPVPKIKTGKPIIVLSKPSEYVKKYVKLLADRADNIRNGMVDPSEDNMLKITNEGRAVAIDARLVDKNAPIDSDSKIYKCADNIKKIYNETDSVKGAQLVFLDTGIWIYDVIKEELMKQGIPKKEIAFIHDANNETQKAKLFADVRAGNVRVLIGSTQKMGAGTNIQKRLAAVHHLDCPWRPSDIEQRDGRIIRQGNRFDEVGVYRYVTENTFDAYLWQIQENKQKFITQIMTNKSVARSCDDIDDAVLDCAEVKTLCTGDPRIKEKMQLDNDVYMLQNTKAAFLKQRAKLHNIIATTPKSIENQKEIILKLEQDSKKYSENKTADFSIEIGGIVFAERAKAAKHLATLLATKANGEMTLGRYCGFDISSKGESGFDGYTVKISGEYENLITSGTSALGCITRLENACDNLPKFLAKAKEDLSLMQSELFSATEEIKKPFSDEENLKEMLKRQITLNAQMEIGSAPEQIADEQHELPKTTITPRREREEIDDEFEFER